MKQKNPKKSSPKDASKLRVGIVVSDYYPEITGALLEGAQKELLSWGVKEKNITIVHVPGSFEIPYGAMTLLKQKRINGIITLGCIIKGETTHDQHISTAVFVSLMNLMQEYERLVTTGIITALNLEQAIARSLGEENRGIHAARALLELLA